MMDNMNGSVAKIMIVGVGGGGGNAVAHFAERQG